MKTGKRKSEQENGINKRSLARTLTLTATLAALGTSLGVDVNTLFAGEPISEEGILDSTESQQIKFHVFPHWNAYPPNPFIPYKLTPLPELNLDGSVDDVEGL
jgi:hypothetical protein